MDILPQVVKAFVQYVVIHVPDPWRVVLRTIHRDVSLCERLWCGVNSKKSGKVGCIKTICLEQSVECCS